MCPGAKRLCPDVAGHEKAQPRCAWVQTGFAQRWLGTKTLSPDMPGCKEALPRCGWARTGSAQMCPGANRSQLSSGTVQGKGEG